MSYDQKLYVSPRTREIERIFQTNKPDIQADIKSLEMSVREIARKWQVNDRNVVRWAERVGVDIDERKKQRIAQGYAAPNRSSRPTQCLKDDVPQAHRLVGLW